MKIDLARRDEYRKLAKEQGYRSRSSYKLIELNKKYNLLKLNDTILDIGSAPGGWLQVSTKFAGPDGKVVGIDVDSVKPISDTAIIQANIEDPNIIQIINNVCPFSYDVVLSDLSPNVSGIWHFDHERQISLTLIALKMSTKTFKKWWTRGVQDF